MPFLKNSGIDFIGGFGENLVVASAYFAELSEFMKAIEIAFAMNCSNRYKTYSTAWFLLEIWIWLSHVFREENQCVDCLVKARLIQLSGLLT